MRGNCASKPTPNSSCCRKWIKQAGVRPPVRRRTASNSRYPRTASLGVDPHRAGGGVSGQAQFDQPLDQVRV